MVYIVYKKLLIVDEYIAILTLSRISRHVAKTEAVKISKLFNLSNYFRM